MPELPWAPPPPPVSLEGITRLQQRTQAELALLEAKLEALQRPVAAPRSRPGRRVRVWRQLDTAAARWAAPWWALTWLLTWGRQGRLPWTWEEEPHPADLQVRPAPPPPPPAKRYTGNTGTR